MKGSPNVFLRYPKLDKGSLKLQLYAVASDGNNYEKESQLGYLIFLTDDSKSYQTLHWSSHKSKLVTRSALGSEVMAFGYEFDMFLL